MTIIVQVRGRGYKTWMARMPGLTVTRSHVPFFNKIKVALSKSKAPKELETIVISAQSVAVDPGPVPQSHPPENCTSQSFKNNLHIALHSGTTSTPIAIGTSSLLLPIPIPYRPYESPLTINDLPPEILAEIFHMYMFWEDESDLIDPELEGMVSVFLPNPRSAPLLFCQVCGYWRDVAISTPSLWSAIALRDQFNLELVKIWLERSQTYPLSIFVSMGEHLSLTVSERIPRLMEILSCHVSRWQRVSFHLPTTKDMGRLISTVIPSEGRSPAMLLQNFHISTRYRDLGHLDAKSLRLLSSFPHPTLQRFTWSSTLIPDFAHLPASFWTNLQQISFDRTTTGVLHAFLKACTNIRFVNINLMRVTYAPDWPKTPTIAHKLQVLNIGSTVGDLTTAVELLVAPNLKRLSFGHAGCRGQSVGFQQFLERSRCKLDVLSISCDTPTFDEAEISIMLRAPIFTLIPNFSLRIIDKACHPSFPPAIISEAATQWSATAYAYHEPRNYTYHLGWGALDLVRSHHIDYPFLVKGPKRVRKWGVACIDGPTTSA